MTFEPAIRQNTAIILALAGASGSGKTKSALELAVGLAGRGSIAVIDTEGRRALHYAPTTIGSPELYAGEYRFMHAPWEPPYTPEALGKLLREAERKYAVVIVDSMSDEHEGEGGLCDMAAAEYERQTGNKNSAAAWAKPKAEHKMHIVRWLRQARCHVIFCLRADEKVEFQLVNGRTKVVPLGWTPIAEKRLLYDVTTSLLFTPDAPGVPKPIKLYDKHAPFFPPDRQVSREAGMRLAAWAAGGVAVLSGEVQNADFPNRIEANFLDERRVDLNATAERKAREGSAEFKVWWTELPRHERDLIRGMVRRYEGIAREADGATV